MDLLDKVMRDSRGICSSTVTFLYSFTMCRLTHYMSSEPPFGMEDVMHVSLVAGMITAIFSLIKIATTHDVEVDVDEFSMQEGRPILKENVISVTLTAVLSFAGACAGLGGYTYIITGLFVVYLILLYRRIYDQKILSGGLFGAISAAVATGLKIGGPNIAQNIVVGVIGGLFAGFLVAVVVLISTVGQK